MTKDKACSCCDWRGKVSPWTVKCPECGNLNLEDNKRYGEERI